MKKYTTKEAAEMLAYTAGLDLEYDEEIIRDAFEESGETAEDYATEIAGDMEADASNWQTVFDDENDRAEFIAALAEWFKEVA